MDRGFLFLGGKHGGDVAPCPHLGFGLGFPCVPGFWLSTRRAETRVDPDESSMTGTVYARESD